MGWSPRWGVWAEMLHLPRGRPYKNEAASHDDIRQAATTLCDMLHRNQQQFPGLREVLGPSHPLVLEILSDLERVSMMLEDRPRAT